LYFQFNAWPSQEENLPNSIHDIIRFIEMAAVSKRELLGPVLVYSRLAFPVCEYTCDIIHPMGNASAQKHSDEIDKS
jgi:hypothetical protein